MSGNGEVTAFLSCSVRPCDRPLVDALAKKVFEPLGFRCLTVGLNVSGPQHIDSAIRDLISQAHCLIGVATERYTATDVASPDRTLSLATLYLVQETSMAFQKGLPYLIIKTPDVHLEAVTASNLWLEVANELSPAGRPVFKGNRDLVHSSLNKLRELALEQKKKATKDKVWRIVGGASTGVLSLLALGKAFSWLTSEKEKEPSPEEVELAVCAYALKQVNHQKLGKLLNGHVSPLPSTKDERIKALLNLGMPGTQLLAACLTVENLRSVCRAFSLDTGGSKKNDLIARVEKTWTIS